MRGVADLAEGDRRGVHRPLIACSVVALLTVVLLSPARARTTALPTLLTARQAHTLRPQEAERQYPVHLDRAQVTFYDEDLGLFLRDSTDGIWAHVFPAPDFHPHAGDIVSVDAISGPGKFSSVLVYTHLHLLGHASLPDPPVASFDRVLSGELDSRWIAVRGIVRSIRPLWDDDLAITLASGPDRIEVVTRRPTAIPGNLIDAAVRVEASAGANFNDRNQLVGTYLFMPDFSFLRVEASPVDPFTRPARRVEDVMRPGVRGPGHMVHVRGVVTSTWGSQHFSLMGPEHGIYVTTLDPVTVNVGDIADVAGFPSIGDYTAVLENSIVRRLGWTPPPLPVRLAAKEALTGTHDAESIEVEGVFLSHSHDDRDVPSMLLSDGGVSFFAVLPAGTRHDEIDQLRAGSRLRIRGICVIHAADDKTPRELSILLRSPADVVVLHRPSWWTAEHTLFVALLFWALALTVAGWNFVLRQQVRRHTETIREQLHEADALRLQAEAAHREKSKSLASVLSLQRELLEAQEKLRYQATHDPLTGLWNRRALLELLEKEIERCCRTGLSMGILMLDVDHFKPVNDSLGHLAGDQVLREIAVRIAHATRGYDLCGRYGGEEFLILLPGCNREQTRASAERIRSAISLAPVVVAESAISLTVSIGATVAPDCARTEMEILSLADRALYEAKSAGRDRTILRISAEEVAAEIS